MANEKRIRALAVGGLVEDNPLTAGAVTLNSAGAAAMPAIGATEHAAIILDPDGDFGAPEVAWVTAHTAAATSFTIARGMEGTTARQHDRDVPWIHGPTLTDFYGAPGGMGLIGVTRYVPPGNLSTTSTTDVDADATNLKVDFVAPPSGKVLVALVGPAYAVPNPTNYYWGLREGAVSVVTSADYPSGTLDRVVAANVHMLVTGLTPGSAHTYKWAHRVASGTGYLLAACAFTMEVWAVNA